MGKSYYEQLAKNIKSGLYPNGVRIPYYIQTVRDADKVDAHKRRVLKKKMQEGVK